MKHSILLIFISVVLIILTLLLIEFLIIKYNGSNLPAPVIDRKPIMLGLGPELTYVVMGDSTSIGQGTNYNHSYAMASAKHLARKYRVRFINVGVSGAVAKTVLDVQLRQAVKYKPDVVLLGVGANDATHFTSGKTIKTSIQQVADGLKKANSQIRIIVTGSPAMDSVSRFRWPVKQIMGLRTRQVNTAVALVIKECQLTLAPIAIKTRKAFLADPTLFAADKFHPNARGYALWTPIINDALDKALQAPSYKLPKL